jgi:hypothetical protein
MTWLGTRNLLSMLVAESEVPLVQAFGVPGTDDRTRLKVPAGFVVSSIVVMDLPANDKQVTLEHPGFNTNTLPGLEPTTLDFPRVRWLVRAGDPTGQGVHYQLVEPVPDATPTTGEIQPGQDVAMVTESGAGLIRLTNIGEVAAYPGLRPAPGHVFIEVLVSLVDQSNSYVNLQGWRATGEGGVELAIVHQVYGADQIQGVPRALIGEEDTRDGWFVIEAPATGPVRLEYHREYLSDDMFWIQLRP